jgi:aspartate aminotransferase
MQLVILDGRLVRDPLSLRRPNRPDPGAGASVLVMPRTERLRRIERSIDHFLGPIRELGPHMADPEACDFLAGNPEVPALPGYVDILRRWIEPKDRRWFGYGFGDPRAGAAAAEALSGELGIAFEAEDILLTRGAHGALGLAMSLVMEPGDEVVFVSPPWFFYEAMILGAGGEPVRVHVDRSTWDLDVDAIAAALTERTRIVLINTPNNPTGTIYPAGTLERLGAALREAADRFEREIFLLSDEAYSKVLFDGNRMVTPAHWYERTFLVHTYSKSTLAPGQRLGFLAMPPTMPDREWYREMSFVAGVATANALPDNVMQYALPDIESGVLLDMARLQARRDRVLEALRSFGYQVHTPQATFYLLVKCPIEDDVAFARHLAEDKVLVLPGIACELPGWFRISLTGTDDMFDRALPILKRAAPGR